jgi:hypothetical protein
MERIELVEEGVEAKQPKEAAFFKLVERFRAAADPKEVERLGEELSIDNLNDMRQVSAAAFKRSVGSHNSFYDFLGGPPSRESDGRFEFLHRRNVDRMKFSFLVRWVGIRRGHGFRDADNGFLVTGVVEENPVAFLHRLKMFLGNRISDAGP